MWNYFNTGTDAEQRAETWSAEIVDEYPPIAHQVNWDSAGYDGRFEVGMTACVESHVGAEGGSLSVRFFNLGWAKSHSFFTSQTPVMKYNRNLMQAILWDRLPIAKIVNVTVISLDQAPEGYREFDGGAPRKFVIDPHGMLKAA